MKFAIINSSYTFAINMLTPLPDEQRAQGGLFTYKSSLKSAVGAPHKKIVAVFFSFYTFEYNTI